MDVSAEPDGVVLFVNGTLMRGLALHSNLAGAELLGEAHTAPMYRLYRGPVQLDDGRLVQGILYPSQRAEGVHRDIFTYADWRAYRAAHLGNGAARV